MRDIYEKIVVDTEGLNLSKIVWRRFKKPMPGVVERTLSENRELADAGRILPVGTEFVLSADRKQAERELEQIKLW